MHVFSIAGHLLSLTYNFVHLVFDLNHKRVKTYTTRMCKTTYTNTLKNLQVILSKKCRKVIVRCINPYKYIKT